MKIKMLFILVLCFQTIWATHNRAGYITYRYISHLNYEVTITTFTKASSTQADRDTVNLDWGDGATEKVLRSNGSVGSNGVPQGEALPGTDIKLNIYTSSAHTYSSPCDYYVSMTDPNRVSNIININGGASVNIPFYIEALIKIESGNTCNNSGAVLLAHPIFLGNLNDTFTFSPTIMDPDGDSLYFELIPTLLSHEYQVPNYEYPNEINPGGNNLFSINHTTGEISWFSPQRVGTYNVTIRTVEYKNGLSYGYTVFDFQIIVDDQIADPPSFGPNWQTDVNGNYSFTVNPGDTLQLDFSAFALYLSEIGEVFETSPQAIFSQSGSTLNLNGSFQWVPDSSHSRLYPYITTFRATMNTTYPLERDLTVLIYVTGGSRSTCPMPACATSIKSGLGLQSTPSVCPNPFSSSCKIKLNWTVASNEVMTLKLYDSTGRYLFSLQSAEGEFILKKGKLSEGLYLFGIYNDSSNLISTGKVILE